MNQGEIIIYQIDSTSFQLDVRIKNDTVWLNRHQIALLFDRDIKTIGKHITNALKEELRNVSVVAKFATTASDGKTYQVEHYNLDMIISIGYRVKSERGILFRAWANKILKEYLLQGHVFDHRMKRIETEVDYLIKKTKEFDLHIKTTLPRHEGIFYNGQIFDAYSFVSEILKSAKKSIIIIDNYVDESVLFLLSKRHEKVNALIYTQRITKQLKLDLERFNTQYKPIQIKEFSKSHDRFVIIDQTTVYHIGASLKDLGKKWFAFSKMNMNASDILQKLNEL